MSRFARTADIVAARQDARAAELEEQVLAFVQPRGDERALDSGTGAGALALALAPHVAEVVGVDVEPALLARAASARPITRRSRKRTQRDCRSPTRRSTSWERCARCTTCAGPSSRSQSSFA